MSDARLRTLERTWQESGLVEDETRLLIEKQRTGLLTESQIYTAAYLGHEAARGCGPFGLYDQTGLINDHIVGICPCADCKWDESHRRWVGGLINWSQDLPFPGIDDAHAEQELKIRMGRALAASAWEKLYSAEEPFGAYVRADLRADRFLAERTLEARAACRELWDDPDWGALDWAHQVLYYIFNPTGIGNLLVWFRDTALILGDRCETCGGSGNTVELAAGETGQFVMDEPCGYCDGIGGRFDFPEARRVVETALLPWVLKEDPCL